MHAGADLIGIENDEDTVGDRQTHLDRDEETKSRLADLAAELSEQRIIITSADQLNAENRRAGRDKFKSLKQIRQGNTKRRIEEFEVM